MKAKVAPHAGSVDRNSERSKLILGGKKSLPTRGAWIEILSGSQRDFDEYVAPHAGSVDRNAVHHDAVGGKLVAPHAGSVDRNCSATASGKWTMGSLPTRGAWIEIGLHSPTPQT